MKKKNNDPDDVPLMEGLSYFLPDPGYHKYLKWVRELKEVGGIVLFGLFYLFLLQWKCTCTCGAAYIFTTTARYANSDHALVMALCHGYVLKYIVTTYNIACQYGIHIVERFQKNFPDLTDGIGRIELLILKLHLQAHKDNWQY